MAAKIRFLLIPYEKFCSMELQPSGIDQSVHAIHVD